jgi:hypothetical protein
MDPSYAASGKKIFLLYPHSVIRDDMLDVLIMGGYETYTLLDEKKATKLLAKFPDSIMFVNIDEGMKEKDWEIYIKSIQAESKIKNCRLGIMSYNQDVDLMKKYLMEVGVQCGYVQLKLGLQESTKIIINVLEANEARGRRKFIRAECADDINATINYTTDYGVFRGKILDISAAGIAAKFDSIAKIPVNSVLPGVQLRLRGGIVMADMIYLGSRPNDKLVQILLFDPKLSTDNKLTIHRYIKLCLQKYINGLKF